MRNKTSIILALAAISLAPAATLLTGCGGGGGGGVAGSSGGGLFAGRTFSGNVTFGPQTGRLVLNINSSNVATGTFTVSTRVRATAPISNGAYSVTGNIDPTTGAFSLTITQGGTPQTFTVTGNLPTDTTPGRFTLSDGASTYTGTISEGTVPLEGGLVITSASGTVNTATLNNLVTSSGTINTTTFAGTSSDPASSPVRHLDITLQNTTGTGIIVDTRFAVNSLDPTFSGFTALSKYRQGAAEWNAASGTIRVTTVGSGTVTVLLQNVRFEADTTTGATGGFTLNGSHTYTGVTGP